ncbi:hypothetical protein GCM10011488_68370 [Steroidobacter agaridevorans]|nr:hypothetical protein GCM10011488_68370 [Steroidobacter agaridevorans]
MNPVPPSMRMRKGVEAKRVLFGTTSFSLATARRVPLVSPDPTQVAAVCARNSRRFGIRLRAYGILLGKQTILESKTQ